MSPRGLLVVLALLPLSVVAQVSITRPQAEPAPVEQAASFNAPTMTVLRANCPVHMEEAQWLKMMEEPVHRSLYPLLVTQAMLYSLDATQLDTRFQYVMVKELPEGSR
jgi:hypothetical protein